MKHKNQFFSRTISKQSKKQIAIEQTDQTKTRRSYFKLAKNNQNLSTIIKDLQTNVKQLKNFHQSLQKNKKNHLLKSSSLEQIQRFKFTAKIKSKSSMPNKDHRNLKKKSLLGRNKQNNSQNINNQGTESIMSKNCQQNGSTMLSIHNADIEEVKKAYQFTYGKQNTNIIDLYNFYKKNVEKNTQLKFGSIQMSSYPNLQHSEELIKSKQIINHRKSNQLLNIIIEDKKQRQPLAQISQQVENKEEQIYKRSFEKNRTMEEIFKGGCPDLANVFDFVKKRRVSLKNYMNLNKNKQNQLDLVNDHQFKQLNNQKKEQNSQLIKSFTNRQLKISAIFQSKIEQHREPNNFERIPPCVERSIQKKYQDRMASLEPQLFQQKYLPSKSSKKSKKSSIKKSKQKQLNDLDENLSSVQINDTNQMSNQISENKKQKNAFISNFEERLRFQLSEDKNLQKFKKSKYYVEPIPLQKENSLDGCSISVKSSSRIIELDFIPLDL